MVAACSALKRSYREQLSGFCPEIVFLYLEIDPATARRRVGSPQGPFMPASLVDSQFAILSEPPAAVRGTTLDATRSVGELVAAAVRKIRGS